MTSPSRVSQRYDAALVVGAALSLYWSLYVQPVGGEVIAFALGSVPVAVGLYLFVPANRYVLDGLLGLLAVTLGGMAPPSILTGTRAGRWLVGGSPFPLAFGAAVLVVLGVLVLRRSLHGAATSTADVTP